MSNDSTKKTLVVALGVCLVCSILVSTAAVTLKGIQKENQKLDRLKNILAAGDLLEGVEDIVEVYEQNIRAVLIDLKTGETIPDSAYTDALRPDAFDVKTVSKDQALSMAVPRDRDIAGIQRMPKSMVVYQVVQNDQIRRFILPIFGKGLWSTMYGFIALEPDLRTISGFTFYDHGETPGLGGEVDNPRWKRIWVGKQAFDVEGHVRIQVIKGAVDATRADAVYQVDGLSGSTLTTRGVDNTVRFWLGEDGYGPYIRRLGREG